MSEDDSAAEPLILSMAPGPGKTRACAGRSGYARPKHYVWGERPHIHLDHYMHLVVPITKTDLRGRMCIDPTVIYRKVDKEFFQQETGCRVCWQCRERAVSDWVGRSLAEAALSEWVCPVTLTYGPDSGFASKVITPKHFQDAIRSIRKRGHKIRYFGVGEYGEKKGRAHFHAVLFGSRVGNPKKPQLDQPPVSQYFANVHEAWWPHGHLRAEPRGTDSAVRYAAKYQTKSYGQGWFTVSKKPPLGHGWFALQAQTFVEAGVMPTSFRYQPPGGQRGRFYVMRGKTRANFIDALVAGYEARWGIIDLDRCTETVREAIDDHYRRIRNAQREEEEQARLVAHIEHRTEQARNGRFAKAS